MPNLRLGLLACLAALAAPAATVTATQVKLVTTLGDITVNLLPDAAPHSVDAFVSYVNLGYYDATLIQRAVPGFVVQGGGFFVDGAGNVNQITRQLSTLASEAKVSNTRGTLAFALSTGPNTARTDWFFNLGDNSALLDGANDGGPFTVFARVADDNSQKVVDSIASQTVLNLAGSLGGAFGSVPVVNVAANGTPTVANLVYLLSADAILAVGSPDYRITASPAALSLKAGASGLSTISVTPVNGYAGALTPGCGTLPSGSSCTFSPSTLTFTAGSTAAQTSTLTVTTKATTAMNDLGGPAAGRAGPAGFGAGSVGSGGGTGLGALAGLLGLACIALALAQRTRRFAGYALLLAVGFFSALPACGGSSATVTPPASAKSFNVPIRLTDGSVSHPVGLSITLN